ncbi:MAG: amino acid ABC transporter permease [Erysipelotrichaceae bacterium]|jgi:putative lysine transport system permease protein|nr:amino acid ABC transporter permease [Erysipelotrichaceae bacterium]
MNLGDDIANLLTNYWREFLLGLAGTLLLSVVGTGVGLFLGVFLALGKRMKPRPSDNPFQKIGKRILRGLSSAYSAVIRGTPMMVQAILFKYGCMAMGVNWNNVLPGIDVFNGWMVAGLIVITLNTTAYMCEVVLSGLNGVDKGQEEGARSLGLSSSQTLWSVVLPQALRNAIPTIGNEWIVNIKDSSVLNVIGVAELYFEAYMAANSTYAFMASYLIIAVIYLLLTLGSNLILKLVGIKLEGKRIFRFSHKKGVAA